MCMTGYILSRFHSELFLETLAEIRRIIESHHVAYLIDAVLVFQQEGSRFLQSDNLNHFIRRRIGQSLDFHKQSGTLIHNFSAKKSTDSSSLFRFSSIR